MKPFVKWAGGKRQILDKIFVFVEKYNKDHPKHDFTYFEPFIGGGAVFFTLQPRKAVISDLNKDLINAYQVIRSSHYLELIKLLKIYQDNYLNGNMDEFFYDVRSLDRGPGWNEVGNVEKAARMIFLNKTCYNGLYRVNSRGEFNTPIGRYQNPLICDEENIIKIHNYLSIDKINIRCCSYEKSIRKANHGDLVYIDPPYDYEDNDGFTKYQMSGFTFQDFKKLKKCCDIAIEKGATIIISNNATSRVLDLFKNDPNYSIKYETEQINTFRTINCDGSKRFTGKEVIIYGTLNPFPQANVFEKIIELLRSKEEDLSNDKKICEILNVKTQRQANYYVSSLEYLGLLNKERKFTSLAKEINFNEETLKKGLFAILIKKDIFKYCYNSLEKNDFNEKQLEKMICCYGSELGKNTIKRRISTIKSWSKWMIDYKNE